MTGASPPQYVVRAGDPLRDRDAVLSAWRGNLGQEDRMAAKYDWFYLACPYGSPLLELLSEGGDNEGCLGTACAGRRRLRLRGEDVRAGVLVDLVVMPEHRSLGPALMLQQGLIAASEGQMDVLYGFPNPKAVALCKRVGYRHLTDLVRYARVLRHRRYLQARMPGWLALPTGWLADAVIALRDGWRRLRDPRLRHEWSGSADARMDALWQGSSQGEGAVGVRDQLHARWRFDESPLAVVRYLWLTNARSNAAQAWFATKIRDEALHVLDFWSVNGARGLSPHHVRALLAAARIEGHASVSVEISGSEEQLHAWKDCGFKSRSGRPVYARWNRNTADDLPDWFLTSADEDE